MAAVAVLFVSTTVMANEPKLESKENSKNLVFEWEAQMADASVRFIDEDGNVIFNDNLITVDTYIKKFNLETLAKGNYILEVENSIKKISYSISVTENDAVIEEKVENQKPFYKKEDGSVFINYLNSDMKEVKIAVYDAQGRRLFKETIEDTFVVEKAFNFKGAYEGEYTIVVNSGSNTFYESIAIK